MGHEISVTNLCVCAIKMHKGKGKGEFMLIEWHENTFTSVTHSNLIMTTSTIMKFTM